MTNPHAADRIKAEAMSIFNDPPQDTSQDVRDVIEWYHAQLRIALSAPAVPEGFKLIAVNSAFDDLMYWLYRCERKGHLENCSDLIEPWAAFDWRDLPAAPQPPEAA